MVHRGVKFSCRFTVAELQSRWYALLYNAEVSRVAIAAMRNLHPDLVAAVQQQALYSTAEEDLLGTLPSVSKRSYLYSYAFPLLITTIFFFFFICMNALVSGTTRLLIFEKKNVAIL